MAFVWKHYGVFTLLCVFVGFLIVVELLVIFLSLKDDIPVDTPAPGRNFSQLYLLDQQICTSVPPLGRAVQAASVRMLSSLSRSGLGGEARSGKFNFGVGTGGRQI